MRGKQSRWQHYLNLHLVPKDTEDRNDWWRIHVIDLSAEGYTAWRGQGEYDKLNNSIVRKWVSEKLCSLNNNTGFCNIYNIVLPHSSYTPAPPCILDMPNKVLSNQQAVGCMWHVDQFKVTQQTQWQKVLWLQCSHCLLHLLCFN